MTSDSLGDAVVTILGGLGLLVLLLVIALGTFDVLRWWFTLLPGPVS